MLGRWIGIRIVSLRQRLWNERPQQQECESGDGSQRKEGNTVAEVLNQLSTKPGAESCAYSNCCREAALDEIESARGASPVRDHEDRDDAKDRICDTVE